MKFSFVIPCYKSSERIANVIGSILDQDYKDYEIICVLDGQDPDAERVIESFMGKKLIGRAEFGEQDCQYVYENSHIRMRVIEHGGACKARNEGLKMATGDFVIFNDSDVYWRPGSLRLYKERLEKTKADGCYAAFKWKDRDDCHMPMDYDPYFLKIFNYIDTNNPIRRSVALEIGGWDESLERWQDWDFWLRVEKHGAKIVRLDEITRDVDFPISKDNISGKNNYEKTFHIVNKKHGFVTPPVIFTSIAAQGHAERIAKLCGWDCWHWPQQIPRDYKAVYLLGMFPESVEDHVRLFMFNNKRRECKYIIHWIGTDVLHMRTMLSWLDIKNIRLMFEKYNVKHFCQSHQNAEELRELGFRVEVLPLPVENRFEEYPMPEQFTVACYDHDGIDQKWHKWLVIELSKAMPDVQFLFFGNKHAIGKEGNTEWLGRVPILDVIKRSSALLRFTIHDGYPVSPIEFMWSGRKVITNVVDMPFTNYINLGVVKDDRMVEIKQLAYREIRKVQAQPNFDAFNQVKQYYEDYLSVENFKKRVLDEIFQEAKN